MSRHRAPRRQGGEPLVSPRRLRTLAAILVAILFAATAVVYDPAANDSFRLPRLLLAETIGLASVCVLLLAALLDALAAGRPAPAGAERPLRWLLAPGTLVAISMLLAAAIAAAASSHPEAVRDGLWHLAIGSVCVVGWSLGFERQTLRRLLDFLLVPAAVLALIGVLQAAGVYQPLDLVRREEGRFAVMSLAGNVGDLAAYLALPTVLALVGWLTRRGRRRVWCGAALGLFTAALVLGNTLTVLVAVVLGGLAAAAILLDRRRLMRLGAVLAIAVTLGALALPGLGGRMRQAARALGRGELNTLMTGRLDAWRAAIWMLRRRPLVGIGVGSYAAEFPEARLSQLRAAGGLGRRSNAFFEHAHNDYLQWIAETGLGGALALLAGLTLVVRALRRQAPRPESPGDLATARSGVAVLAVLALASFPFHLALTAYPALVFLAWLLAPDSGSPTAASRSGVGRGAFVRPVLAGALLGLALAIALHVRRARDRWEADRVLAAVESSTKAALARGEAPPGLLRSHLRALARAERQDPASASLRLARGSQHLLLREPEAAVRAYSEAMRLEARPEIRLNLGRAQLMLGEREAAEWNFLLAVMLEPDLGREVRAALGEGEAH